MVYPLINGNEITEKADGGEDERADPACFIHRLLVIQRLTAPGKSVNGEGLLQLDESGKGFESLRSRLTGVLR